MMSPFLFWAFALLMLIFGAAVVINRNPVASALSLVGSFLGLAALFMSLDAYFLRVAEKQREERKARRAATEAQ